MVVLAVIAAGIAWGSLVQADRMRATSVVAAVAGFVSPLLVTPAPAHADGSQQSLSNAVRQFYTQVQIRCTPNMVPSFQSITTDGHGHGRIIDANPSLGGPFNYLWGPNGSPGTPSAQYHVVPADDGNGIWYIDLQFC
ncbi:hypothetical protein AWC14_01880 [Mycobacterium kyorinense]|uniref:Uncharacterized protein n=2 Tax=Mycobacterium kyorinense TaxID=487514 RepID=A0A1X1Y3V8_9MYCO|nr:hypothetical protein AWC14_01880 [Mycobacterium kyorinense]